MIRHLTFDEGAEIHRQLIDHFGGISGVRDPGLLESALFRPRTGYYDDIVEMAAALFESLLMNHPFLDGNKRVAFFATDVFAPQRLETAGGSQRRTRVSHRPARSGTMRL